MFHGLSSLARRSLRGFLQLIFFLIYFLSPSPVCSFSSWVKLLHVASLLDQLGGGVCQLADHGQGQLLHSPRQLRLRRGSVWVEQVGQEGSVTALLVAFVLMRHGIKLWEEMRIFRLVFSRGASSPDNNYGINRCRLTGPANNTNRMITPIWKLKIHHIVSKEWLTAL